VETISLSEAEREPAPDGSEVRLLLRVTGGGMVHCTLLPGRVSRCLAHRTVDEIWYFLAGRGEVWRKRGEQEETTEVHPGLCLTIPRGTKFQFRNLGDEPLRFLIATIPPWPGAEEAVRARDHWATTELPR
jgi:mannose-6-phosphate isomerase-like protein (cupin superfamily)